MRVHRTVFVRPADDEECQGLLAETYNAVRMDRRHGLCIPDDDDRHPTWIRRALPAHGDLEYAHRTSVGWDRAEIESIRTLLMGCAIELRKLSDEPLLPGTRLTLRDDANRLDTLRNRWSDLLDATRR